MPSIETAVPVLLFATLLFTLRYMPTRYWLAVVIAAIALVCIPLLIPGVTSVSTDPPRFGDLYRLILPYHVALVGIVSLCWSLTSDIVFIALTRYLIRVVAGPGLPALRITAMSIGMLLAGLALVSVPFATLRMVVNVWPAGSVTLLAPFLLISTAMNVANLLVAAVFLFIALAMLVHRIVWPLIGRPLEVISAEHVLLKRWPLFFTGIALLGVSWAPFGAWLKLLQGK